MKTSFQSAFSVFLLGAALAGCGGARDAYCPAPPPCPACDSGPQVPTGPTTEVWIDLPVRILFTTRGSELTAENRAVLDQAVETLRSRTDVIRVQLEGHSDSRGPDALNTELSLERARAVLEYLVSKGVPRAMLDAVGRGAEEPLVVEAGHDENRAQNRRVEFRALVRQPVSSY